MKNASEHGLLRSVQVPGFSLIWWRGAAQGCVSTRGTHAHTHTHTQARPLITPVAAGLFPLKQQSRWASTSLMFLLSSNLWHPNTAKRVLVLALLFLLHCCSVQKYLGKDKRIFVGFCFSFFFLDAAATAEMWSKCRLPASFFIFWLSKLGQLRRNRTL